MSVVVVFYKDNFPINHFFNDFSDALAFASMTYGEEFVQSIRIGYERTEKK